MKGAADAREAYSVCSKDNDAYRYAMTRNILMKNMMDFCIGTPCFWLVGFGIMFAGSGPLIGGDVYKRQG